MPLMFMIFCIQVSCQSLVHTLSEHVAASLELSHTYPLHLGLRLEQDVIVVCYGTGVVSVSTESSTGIRNRS